MMQRLLAFTRSSNKFTSSSSSILRSQPFSPHYRPPLNNPVSTSYFFIKQLSSNTTPSYAAYNKSCHVFFSNPIFANGFHKNIIVRVFKPGFPKRDFGPKRSFSSHFGEWRSRLSRLSSDDVLLGLIAANVAVFMLWRVADQEFMFNNFTLSLNNFKSGRVHTMITSAFSHIDVGHIVSNMVGLYFFGTSIGRYFGSEYLVKLYLAGAIGGSIFYLIQHAFFTRSSEGGQWTRNSSNVPALGASGAVNAIMLLNIFLYPRATLYLDFIIPVPAILLGIFLIGKDMLRLLEGDQQISGSAHLGGAVVAAIALRRIKRGRF
ncbi:unnamed protein product [Rhodiola kirilowii]